MIAAVALKTMHFLVNMILVAGGTRSTFSAIRNGVASFFPKLPSGSVQFIMLCCFISQIHNHLELHLRRIFFSFGTNVQFFWLFRVFQGESKFESFSLVLKRGSECLIGLRSVEIFEIGREMKMRQRFRFSTKNDHFWYF